LVAVNVAYTLLSPGVSLWGHLGGLAAGAVMAWPLTSEKVRTRWITAGVAAAAACVAIWALTIPSTIPVY
ncbi:rhomboid family intramembrane serine protease, partial [Rhizobium brockwellii]|uniref:rhomboid family intramembrane serine protease n=1 Tax=Rhizobium brockwellii TaxID=3019932 RepID=UPI003F9C3839